PFLTAEVLGGWFRPYCRKRRVSDWVSASRVFPRSETEFIWFNPAIDVYSELHFVKGEGGEVTHTGLVPKA
ncbi:MAG TPA: hypothetical protein VK747_05215, partial [Blastocatellia bacterium]|nr:hypothetical protein [Blastocatellia bacterium]